MSAPSKTHAAKPRKRNIRAYASGAFKPHGQIEFWTEGPVVRIEAQGPFNREAFEAVGLAMRELFASTSLGPVFADILEIRHSIMISPEALDAFGQFLALMSANKSAPRAVAYVVAAEVEGRSLVLPLLQRLYDQHGRQFAAFETMAEAEAWVRERLSAPQ
ncbi:hypothetical protein [Pelomonas sp. SE-A7]|uniref:hypothetical protein n=1 Tax=Pelomonas sp. SE-A7 TaxID=3054953 RepID=UPI00259C9BE5|nr:hypothetical protein [Pelomonas sp. SE-A7]MDM4768222.1 hypothetical protein [Pelomonas sp. SE-A7]